MIRLHQTLMSAVLALTYAASFAVPATAQFETRSLTPAIDGPFFVAVGDFNRDGKQDVAIANRTVPVGVGVLLGNGDGTLQAPVVYYPAGTYILCVVAADLNHDGILDLVAVSDGLYVLLGNGDGTFQPAARLTLNSDPNFLAIGDFNADHIPDLVVAESRNFVGSASVLLGNGDGTFQAPIDLSVPCDFVSAVAVGDFDGDHKPDVVAVGRGLPRGVFILLGNGDGTFRHGQIVDVQTDDFLSVAVADFRGIGRLDLAIGAAGPNEKIAVLLGNGDGTFQSPVFYPNFPFQVVTADVNGDQKQDLVAAGPINSERRLSDGVSVLRGNGDGTFQPAQSFFTAIDSRTVAVADMNGDKQLDLINADFVGNVIVLLNTGVVTFSPTTPINFPFQLIGTTSLGQAVTLTNTGATSLTISSITSQGPFSTTTSCKGSLAPGSACALKVRFLPVTEGPAVGTVTIKDSASTKPQVIDLTGAGTVIDLTPLRIVFPPQMVGTSSSPQILTLTNQGTTPVNITSIFMAGTNPKNFAETHTCGSTVAPGASCTITVTFKPLTAGSLNAYVEITDDGGGSPQRVTTTGTGT